MDQTPQRKEDPPVPGRTPFRQVQDKVDQVRDYVQQLRDNLNAMRTGPLSREEQERRIREEQLEIARSVYEAALLDFFAKEKEEREKVSEDQQEEQKNKRIECVIADLQDKSQADEDLKAMVRLYRGFWRLQEITRANEENLNLKNEVLIKKIESTEEEIERLKVRLYMSECELQQDKTKWDSNKGKLAQLLNRAEELQLEVDKVSTGIDDLMEPKTNSVESELSENLETFLGLVQEQRAVVSDLNKMVCQEGVYQYPVLSEMSKQQIKELKKMIKQCAKERKEKRKEVKKLFKEMKRAEINRLKELKKERKKKEAGENFLTKLLLWCF